MILLAPFAFFGLIAVVGGIIWAIIDWSYAKRFEGQSSSITSLEGRIKFKDDQILDYKDRLNGATPLEAKKRIDALELQIKALSPRRITIEQKQIIVSTLSGTRGVISIVQDMAAPDAKPLTADLAGAFQTAGWGVVLPMILGPSNVPQIGLALRVSDVTKLRPEEQTVRSALQAAKIEFELQNGLRRRPPRAAPPPNYPSAPEEPDPDVEIFITTRSN